MGKRRARADPSSNHEVDGSLLAPSGSVPAASRKARRKEERSRKKHKHSISKAKTLIASDGATKAEKRTISTVFTVKPVLSRNEPVAKKKRSFPESSNPAPHARRRTSSVDESGGVDPDLTAALRRDDDEIRALEAKLGLAASKGKKRLNQEYGMEGYGDDFGDFLLDLDSMVERVAGSKKSSLMKHSYSTSEAVEADDEHDDGGDEVDDLSDERVPMKGPAYEELDEDDSFMLEELLDPSENRLDETIGGLSDDGSTSASSEDTTTHPDHDDTLIYRPTEGQDIYGKSLERSNENTEAKKYVPPHMRNKSGENLKEIERTLNRALNRLSEDTLIPTSHAISKVYSSFPSSDVHDSIWKNMHNACVASPTTMTALIPVYVATVCGVHILKGDDAQLGEYLLEKVVLSLWNGLDLERQQKGDLASTRPESNDKAISNLVLIMTYLYNYGVVHCSLMYDLVRHFIDKFHEVDVEALLLVLSHCGRALRSDDPSALKDIILSVQDRAINVSNAGPTSFSSRVDFMVSAMTDLKNNKKRKQDVAYSEKTAKFRKLLGQIKSGVATSTGVARISNASLRISLHDVLQAESKGRWWKVGASWIGNQFSYQEGKPDDCNSDSPNKPLPLEASRSITSEADEKLLKLAHRYRMNTDTRRSIFCIIMGSADCDDAFEKLVRGGFLKPRIEKEAVRVLVECCGGEISYNKFYSHLAHRLCEFQPQCKFSLQLAFWDVFKQFDSLQIRKAANLAKLLFHLVVVQRGVKLNVLKAIDMASPSELPEAAIIFLTLFFSTLLKEFEDPEMVTQFFQTAISRRKPKVDSVDIDQDELEQMDESDALRASMMVFFVQVLKCSPEYTKGSKFRRNLKAAMKVCDVDDFL